MNIDLHADSPYPDPFGPQEIAEEECTNEDRYYKNRSWDCVWAYDGLDSRKKAFEALQILKDAGITKAWIVEVPKTNIQRIWANPQSNS